MINIKWKFSCIITLLIFCQAKMTFSFLFFFSLPLRKPLVFASPFYFSVHSTLESVLSFTSLGVCRTVLYEFVWNSSSILSFSLRSIRGRDSNVALCPRINIDNSWTVNRWSRFHCLAKSFIKASHRKTIILEHERHITCLWDTANLHACFHVRDFTSILKATCHDPAP